MLSIPWVKQHFKCNWCSATRILWSYTIRLMFCIKDKQPTHKHNNNRPKESLKIVLLLAMVAGSSTAMGTLDLITSSTNHKTESIYKKHHKCGHLYTENINSNDRDIIKQVSKYLSPGLFLPSTLSIILITNTGYRDIIYGLKQHYVDGYLMDIKACPCCNLLQTLLYRMITPFKIYSQQEVR